MRMENKRTITKTQKMMMTKRSRTNLRMKPVRKQKSMTNDTGVEFKPKGTKKSIELMFL